MAIDKGDRIEKPKISNWRSVRPRSEPGVSLPKGHVHDCRLTAFFYFLIRFRYLVPFWLWPCLKKQSQCWNRRLYVSMLSIRTYGNFRGFGWFLSGKNKANIFSRQIYLWVENEVEKTKPICAGQRFFLRGIAQKPVCYCSVCLARYWA